MNIKKTLTLTALIFAGECVFILPFLVSRIFRSTFLRVFEINNLELGTAFSVYGIVAMISYFTGGPLADRLSPKKLMAFSLLITAAGGIVMASIPSLTTLTILYGFWGLSTIFLFWAAFIKVTRVIGGIEAQGRSFGAVDAGRGLLAAILASISVLLFNYFLTVDVEIASKEDFATALGKIILVFSALTTFSALLVWLIIPNRDDSTQKGQKLSLQGIKMIINKRSVWMQALIVLCSYVGYKCTDDFSLYASEVLNYNDIEAAKVATITFWIRPFAAILAGYLGDRFMHSRMITIGFGIMALGALAMSTGILPPNIGTLSVFTIAIISVGIYGLRGLYFALLEETKVSLLYTGSAVGFISLIGYTPDVFMGPVMGYVLDSSPGITGHQHLFAILVGFSLLGLFTANKLQRMK